MEKPLAQLCEYQLEIISIVLFGLSPFFELFSFFG
tara:strand:+ start:852 stop:956 length:105 start_codon:yes stop_codon:yes gene_type:complete